MARTTELQFGFNLASKSVLDFMKQTNRIQTSQTGGQLHLTNIFPLQR